MSESRAELPDYEPWVIRWRRGAGPWIKRTLVPNGKYKRQWWWDRVFVQIDEPYFYADSSRDDIFRELRAADRRSADVLDAARRISDSERERREHVERRATALQGAVAIAFGFALAGGGLLLDQASLPQAGWRYAVSAAYLVTLACLAGTAFRALRATARVHAYHVPDPEAPTKRVHLNQTRTELVGAAELLYAYSRNQPIVDYQVSQMRAAGHWFAGAVTSLLVTAALIFGALLGTPEPQTGDAFAAELERQQRELALQVGRLAGQRDALSSRLERLQHQLAAQAQTLADQRALLERVERKVIRRRR